MWELIATNSGIVLGLAISVYSIYSYVETRIIRRRHQFAFLQNLYQEHSNFSRLAKHFGRRAEQVRKIHQDLCIGSFPDPAAEEDGLPAEAELHSKWLVQRAKHLIEYEISPDIEKLGTFLDKEQIELFLKVIEARHAYLRVLTTRALDLESFPRKPGVLTRFVAAAKLNADELNETLKKFAESLNLETPEK